jgi:hypothetical protein
LDGPLDRLRGLARHGAIAVTTGEYSSAMEGNLRPAVWWRDTGGTWHEVASPRELFGGERGGGLVDVAASPSGFVATGGWTGVDGGFGVGVWTSTDGTRWTRVDGDLSLAPRNGSVPQAKAAAGAALGVVLVGARAQASGNYGIAWRSAEGEHWTLASVPGAASLEHVVALPGQFVAIGFTLDGAPSSWRSADGSRWEPGGALPVNGGLAVRLTGLGASGDQLVAAGTVGGHVALWRSSGGGHWRAMRLAPGLDQGGAATAVLVATNATRTVLVVDRPSGPALWETAGLSE